MPGLFPTVRPSTDELQLCARALGQARAPQVAAAPGFSPKPAPQHARSGIFVSLLGARQWAERHRSSVTPGRALVHELEISPAIRAQSIPYPFLRFGNRVMAEPFTTGAG